MSVPDWAPAADDETVVWQGQPRRRVVHLGVAAGVVLGLVVLAGMAALPAGAGHYFALFLVYPEAVA